MADLSTPFFVIAQCVRCSHYALDGSCKAFPDGIPMVIMENKHDHRELFEGDGGVRFLER